MNSREVKIFYSWQSDLPDATNRSAIRRALRSASNEIEQNIPGGHLTVDEATREEPGAPNIPATILGKIEAADIFVADVTTINSDLVSKDGVANTRPTPNPNVVFELGYAAAHLGWARVVLLFNEEFGAINQLPFDFDRHRVSAYRLMDPATTSQKRALAGLLETALGGILSSEPPRPSASRARLDHEIRRERDLKNLERVFSNIHIPSLETHMDEDPYRILHSLDFCWIGFNAEMSSSQMHFYDKQLGDLLRAFHDAWWRSVRYTVEYHPDATPISYAFIFMEFDDPYHMAKGHRQKHWDEMSAARAKMIEIWPQLVKIVQERYLEIDIREMSKARWAEYQAWREKLLNP